MKKFIVGNLKMNLISPREREQYFKSFEQALKGKKFSAVELVLCPPAVHLESFANNLKKGAVKIGAQNVFFEEKGAFTGEVSSSMVKNVGVEFVLVGHSERRRYFSETDSLVNEKIQAVLKNKLTPIFCIGETIEERKREITQEVITSQLHEGLDGISSANLEKIIIAYEPIWAVGTNIVPTADEVLEMKILIKKILVEKYSLRLAEKATILYGGSVNARTIKEVCLDSDMDGVLVGRESLSPRDFVQLAEIIQRGSVK